MLHLVAGHLVEDGLQRLVTRLVGDLTRVAMLSVSDTHDCATTWYRQSLLGGERQRGVLQQSSLRGEAPPPASAEDVRAPAGVASPSCEARAASSRGPRALPPATCPERPEAQRGTGLDAVPRCPHPVGAYRGVLLVYGPGGSQGGTCHHKSAADLRARCSRQFRPQAATPSPNIAPPHEHLKKLLNLIGSPRREPERLPFLFETQHQGVSGEGEGWKHGGAKKRNFRLLGM